MLQDCLTLMGRDTLQTLALMIQVYALRAVSAAYITGRHASAQLEEIAESKSSGLNTTGPPPKMQANVIVVFLEGVVHSNIVGMQL